MNKCGGPNELCIETEGSVSSDNDHRIPIFTPLNCTTPSHLSNYSFVHYLPRRPLTAFAFGNPHSLDESPLTGYRPKSRSFLDFSRQHRPSSVERKGFTFGPGHYSPELPRRPSNIPNFSRQISREKANFRSRRETFVVEDRSLSRTCSLILPRRIVTIFYQPKT
jgi:hypothetical protein